ncbi:hypothetical protein [Horticoccus sp. 23ND18S-11]|uniref:hypothetical protein n=1 Tax=Horticoccus sp. 23ND18S-11 TaxID=3391832 RepID=UPI0039C8FFB5
MPTTVHSKWRGSGGIFLAPTYPRFKRSARGSTLTFVFRGPYVDLRTYGPDTGDSITLGAFDFEPSGELVYANSVECQPDGAGEDGAGTLTVVYTNEGDAGVTLIANNTTVEVDWTLLERPLIQHSLYTTGGSKELTDDDRRKIQTWKDSPSTANYDACSANAKHFVGKLRKGIESYVVAAPVARLTERGTSAPTVSHCGQRSTTAPVSGAPSGYQWLQTGDRGIRQAPAAGWERVREWTGAKEIDADLYTGVI